MADGADGAVAVVGGSLGGLRVAEQLRRSGHAGPVTVYGAEPYPPYNRPPLSKDVLADPALGDAEAMLGLVEFRRRPFLDDVDFRLGTMVESADLAAGRLHWQAAGEQGEARFDGLVVATGLRPLRLPLPGPDAGRHVLRTVADCLDLRAALDRPSRVVVVGGGFIGCEVACTLRGLGHHVTVVEPTGAPLNRVLGEALGAAVQRHHERAGIEFVIGPGVTGFAGDDRVTGVELDTGHRIPADVVVEAVGSRPNTEWLAGNDLDLSDGVLCRNDLAVVGASRAVAVGDVARFPTRSSTTCRAGSSTGRCPPTPRSVPRRPCWPSCAASRPTRRRSPRSRRSGATRASCASRASAPLASATMPGSRKATSATCSAAS
ncbi:MAG: NAD(P)/FAD-dependent oxidoreductase [Nocardioides sp.]